MVDETEFVLRVLLYRWGWEDTKIRIGKASCLLPLIDAALGPWREENAGLFGAALSLRLRPYSFHVIAFDLVLRAIPTVTALVIQQNADAMRCLPLRECFVATDVTALASLASFTALGVAPPRGPSALAGHRVRCKKCVVECEYEYMGPVYA